MNRVFFKEREKAQAASEFVIFAGVLFVVAIVVAYVVSQDILKVRPAKIETALESIRAEVQAFQSLQQDSAKELVIDLPQGITSVSVQGSAVSIMLGAQVFTKEMGFPVRGNFPVSEGTHRLKMFFNGSVVIFYECGNNVVEAFEQCDGSSSYFCQDGMGQCYGPSSAFACRCECDAYDQCYSNACDVAKRVCRWCSSDADCVSGFSCSAGRCVSTLGGEQE